MSKDKYKSLRKNTIIFTIGNLGSSIISFLLIPIYTNYLTTAEYGQIDFISIIITLIIPFITMNFVESIIRFGIDKKYKQKDVLSTSILLITVIFMMFITIGVFSALLGVNVKKYFFYLTLVLVVAYYQIFQQSIRAMEKLKIFALSDILYTIIFSILNIIFIVYLKKGVQGYFGAYIVAYVVATLFIIVTSNFFTKISLKNFNRFYCMEFFKYSLPLIPNSISWWIINVSDRYMIKIFSGYSDLGIYSVANKIPQILNSFYAIFFKAWQISSIKELGEDNVENFYEQVLSGLIKFMFSICMIIILFINIVFSIFIGPEFENAIYYVPVLLLSIVFYTFASFMGTVYTAAKKSRNILVSTLFSAIINITINLIFMKKYGVITACVSTAISYAFLFVYRYFDSKKFMIIKIRIHDMIVPLILVIIMIINVYILGLSYKNIAINSICIFIYAVINIKNIKILCSFLKRGI